MVHRLQSEIAETRSVASQAVEATASLTTTVGQLKKKKTVDRPAPAVLTKPDLARQHAFNERVLTSVDAALESLPDDEEEVRSILLQSKSDLDTRQKHIRIDNLHNYGPGTRFGASQARIGCVVCASRLSFRFFLCFGTWFSEHCCVPRFSNRGRACPSLFSHGVSRSSELRKRWLLAIRQADWSHFRVPNSTVVCSEHVLPEKKVRFHARA